jgi:hypothetical protein
MASKRSGSSQLEPEPEPGSLSQGRRTSKVWEFFNLRPASAAANWKPIAVCPTCSTEFTAASSNGTSHMIRHKCYKEWCKIYDGLDDIVALDRSQI